MTSACTARVWPQCAEGPLLSAMQDMLQCDEMQAGTVCRASSHIACRVALDAAIEGVVEAGHARQCQPHARRAVAKPHESFAGDLQPPRIVSLRFQWGPAAVTIAGSTAQWAAACMSSLA